MTLEKILAIGKAPNAELNSTVESGLQMKQFFTRLFAGSAAAVGNLLINTTIATPEASHLIPVQDVTGLLPEEELYLHLEIFSPALGDQTKWSVKSWERAVKNRGLDLATRDYIALALPGITYVDLPTVLTVFTEALVKMNGAKEATR